MTRLFVSTLIAGAALLPLANAAGAANWDGSSSTDWFTGANWNTNVVPGAADQVNVDILPNAPVINGAAASAGFTRIGNFSAGRLTIENGGTLSSTVGVLGMQNGSNGTMTVRGTNSAWTVNSSLSVGEAGIGELNIENGGKVSSTGTSSVGSSSSTGVGTVTVTGENSLWQIGGGLRLGQSGTGTLRILDQASVTVAGNASFGSNSGELEIASTAGLSVGGSFSQSANGALIIGLNPANSDSGHIQVTGTANISGAPTIEVVNEGPGTYTVGTRYTVLTADGGVSGQYGGLTGDVVVSPFIGLALASDTNNVYIDVALLQSFANAGETPNQSATGAGIESLGGGNPIFDFIANLPSEEAARAAFDLLSGEIHASAKSVLLDESRFLRDAVNTRLRQAFVAENAPQMAMQVGSGKIEAAADITPVRDRSAGFWSYGFGSWGNTDSDGNAAALDRSTGGFFAGADIAAGSDWRIGILGGYSHTSFDVDERASSGSSDNIHAGLYGGSQWDNIGLRLGASYTWHDIETSRDVPVPEPAELTADYSAGTAQLFGELGYRLGTDHLSLEPFAALAYVNLHTEGYSEDGGDTALSTDSETSDTFFTTLGAHWAASLAVGEETSVVFQGNAGWRHAFDDVTPESTLAFGGGDEFKIAGVPIAEDALVVNAGIGVTIAQSATLGVSYSGQIAKDAEDHGLTGSLAIAF